MVVCAFAEGLNLMLSIYVALEFLRGQSDRSTLTLGFVEADLAADFSGECLKDAVRHFGSVDGSGRAFAVVQTTRCIATAHSCRLSFSSLIVTSYGFRRFGWAGGQRKI